MTRNSIQTEIIEELYGDQYDHSICERNVTGLNFTTMSDACKKVFEHENCFYECDKNAGKFRRFHDCNENDSDTGNDDSWSIHNVPIKASVADAMYEVCKEDYLPNGKNIFTDWGTVINIANVSGVLENNGTGTCKKGKEIWTNGKDMLESAWGAAFKYETNEAAGYVWTFPEGQANPNNDVLMDKPYQLFSCNFHNDTDYLNHQDAKDKCPADWHLHETSGWESLSPSTPKVVAYALASVSAFFFLV